MGFMAVIWELDFYSRPLVDENQKKVWEVLICESPSNINTRLDSLFRYSEFCANTEVNSVRLRRALEDAIAQSPKRPDKIRFFRSQMTNMITKACEEAEVPAYLSRRTLALSGWLDDRMANYYPTLPNYQASTNPSVAIPAPPPQPLPDALVGQQWAFVTLEARAFADMPEWEISFGEAFPLELAKLAPEAKVPGLIIFSSRALPLAAWMSGLELAFFRYDAPSQTLLLETGGNDAWILARLSNADQQTEAQNFEAAKQAAHQVHFVAVQANPDSEEFAGFWLLRQLAL
jgi:hypothetical protein